MLKKTRRLAPAVALLAIGSICGASEDMLVKGKELHDRHCLRCHDTSVYTRKDRMIQNAAQLEAQVARCAAGPAEVDWSHDQIDSVARYIGETFYGFW
jgi:hypothetical protein